MSTDLQSDEKVGKETVPSTEPVNGDSHTARHDETTTTKSSTKKRGNQWDDVSRQAWHENKKLPTNSDSDVPDGPRLPKRKVACLVGYCGTGYHGMQLNPPNKTIEGTLFDAFVKVGAVSSDNADDPKKVAFLRAARTDKGVHAAVNVISLKMIIEDSELVQKINAVLPEQIRVWSILRTIKSFNPRSSCDSRIYEYLLPTATFLPPSPEYSVVGLIKEKNSPNVLKDSANGFWQKVAESTEDVKRSETYLSIRDDDPEIGVLVNDHSIAEEEKPAAHAKLRRAKMLKENVASHKRAYRISAERLQLLRDALALYKGTKNFHNYTVGQTFKQPNSKRVVRSFETGEPFLINGTEWLSLKVHGQSFMLHQIRKMVAMAILLVRYSAPLSVLDKSYQDVKFSIPKAPSLGLLLERPIFDVYNTKASETAEREGIDLTKQNAEVEAFKKKHLYDKIYAEEETDNVFNNFLSSLDAYASTGEFGYLFGMEQSSKASRGVDKHDGNDDPLSEDTALALQKVDNEE